jgi:hypothetical protein
LRGAAGRSCVIRTARACSPAISVTRCSGRRSTGCPMSRGSIWFAAFLADRGTRKPSLHTMKAYRQDFDAIATVISGGDAGDVSRMSLGDTTTDTMRIAFAQ